MFLPEEMALRNTFKSYRAAL